MVLKEKTLIKRKTILTQALRREMVYADVMIAGKLYRGLVVRDVRKQRHEIEVLVLEGWKFPKRVYLKCLPETP